MNIKINSDFTDYYDDLQDSTSEIVYNRVLKTTEQRGTLLKQLREMGIKTIDIKQVNQFTTLDDKIVVYTDPTLHNGLGKKIMDVQEAQQMYYNSLASLYISESKYTVKFLQIGKRRITMYFKKNDSHTLDMGQLDSIAESPSEFNRRVGCPIYSIDYISSNGALLATDFNKCENLARLGINKYITGCNIMAEISESLLAYNKSSKEHSNEQHDQ